MKKNLVHEQQKKLVHKRKNNLVHDKKKQLSEKIANKINYYLKFIW